jgi:PAS domain S-box-containing protein/putative nucleotidyltransferase with HDIG domain
MRISLNRRSIPGYGSLSTLMTMSENMTGGQLSDLEPIPKAPHDQYQRVVEDMPVMLWTADEGGHWTHVNRRWTDYTGLVGVVPGFGFEAALHPDDVAPTVEVWTQAVESRRPYDIEYRLRDVKGQYRWFVVQGRHFRHPAVPDIAWVGSCTDIDEQKRAEEEARAARLSAIRALGLALEARDRETSGHTDRVTGLALRLGRALGLSDLRDLEIGAYLHDLGKIAIPDAVLLKPGPLDAGERAVINTHVTEGVRFAAALGFVQPQALALIRHHHERWDGAGYPDKLGGEQIPYLARLFAVVDTYDALVSVRPYKPAWSTVEACVELQAQAGRQFDPDMVEVFLALHPEELEGG